jgi:cobalt-zinc-cadmium efflux system protein
MAAMHSELAQARRAGRRALSVALLIALAVVGLEVIGGFLTNSLALLADAGHMTSDVLAVALALGAIWMAGRPASSRQTFGYQRAEVLAAAANGLALIAVAAFVLWQAAVRFSDPPEVESGAMLTIAVVGLVANVVSARVLSSHHDDSINIRGAFYHVLGDLVGSIGAVTAGVVMLTTGWYLADPLAGLFIGALLLLAAARLLRESLAVLLETVPPHIDAQEIEDALTGTPGVSGLHDLHIWTVTSGLVALSCHCELSGEEDTDRVLARLCDMLHDRFDIHHVTIQPELHRLHGDATAHSLPRCTSVIGHEHRSDGAVTVSGRQ